MENANKRPEQSTYQFSMLAILSVTTAVAMLLSYAASIGPESTRQLLVYLLVALVTAIVAGLIARDFGNALFWSVLTNVLIYLAVAGGRLPSENVVYAWSAVGASCGALSGIEWPKNFPLRCATSGIVAGCVMVAALKLLKEDIRELIWFDVLCAVPIGIVLCVAIYGLKQFLAASRHPPLIMAAWMCGLILLGNLLVPIIGGVQR
ncbi:MAG TPA: hypothetical protein DDW52_11630 [Planctomycetaceae bacterium]|nr:hypothetical protein [Planctomycetaceae bacterium]